MLQSIIIIGVFLIISVLMIKRILPTILALPILAVLIAIVAGVPFMGDEGILNVVVDQGVVRMASAAFVAIIGAWLGELMTESGISKKIIKFAAELGGDKPVFIVLTLSIATMILFTSIGGLGAVIMVATISIPIMMSIGMPAVSAASLFLLSFGTGITINLGNWIFYSEATGVDINIIKEFTFILFGLSAVATLAFAFVELKKIGLKKQCPKLDLDRDSDEERDIPKLALIAPLIPLILVIGFGWAVIPAFFASIVYTALTIGMKPMDAINLVTKAGVEGAKVAGPAILLLGGIGMLLNSVMHPTVSAVMEPLLVAVIPTTTIGYVLFFCILAPLALYRGPLNLWGLGSGILALIIGLNLLSPGAGMGAILATERIQGIADPTNSHNVWVANFAGINPNDLLKKLLPYAWAITVVGVIISAIKFL